MRLIDRLQDTQAPMPTGLPGISRWRVYLVERQEADVAIRRATFGGPYTPPSLKSSANAELFVQWADGQCSQTTLNRAQLQDPDESLLTLRSQAFPDPYPEHVPGPSELPELRVCVPEVKDAILHDPSTFVTSMQNMAESLKGIPTEQVRAWFQAEYARVTFVSSEGANSSHETTSIRYGVSLSSRAGFGHELRRMPSQDQIQARLHRVRQDYDLLDRPYDGELHNPMVLLAPNLTRLFLNYYLLQNMSMQAILNGASAFTREQLENHEPLFHPSLNIIDHPRRDEHPSAFRLCQRGQVPLERPLISEGRLMAADVSLRAATQGGLEPTPTSLTENWIIDGFLPGDEQKLERELEGVDNAVLLYSVLGLHTGDPVRGAYSLGVPRGLVVKNGRIQGYVRGTVVGNFFRDMRSPWTPRVDPLSEVPILPLQASFAVGK